MTDDKNIGPRNGRPLSPWLWVPTLYFAEGIPYFIVNTISVIMFKNLGMGNAQIGLCTSLLYLPWVIKPLWSPFIDIIRTKRWWIVLTQGLVTAALLLAAFTVLRVPALSSLSNEAAGVSDAAEALAGSVTTLPSSAPVFTLTLILFWITAFASSTHDIAADGFYMLALEGGTQSLFVGIRSLFYRLSSVFGQGVLVVVAGILETRTGNIPLAWALTLGISALIFAALTVYHAFFLPRPSSDSLRVPSNVNPSPAETTRPSSAEGSNVETDAQPSAVGPSAAFTTSAKEIFREFGRTFATFFRKKGVVLALVFLLLYRLPEALLLKMLNPFLLDPVSKGGLGLTTEAVGIVYGTVGVIALIVGGILGGVAASRWGLKKSLLPMSLCIALPCLVYLYMALAQPSSSLVISSCVALDQFGYGFGFTAYMLYMMYYSEGEFKTAHYSLCTAFMALSMMLPGLVAGFLQERLGYTGFFILVAICCLVTVAVTFCVNVDPKYGKYKNEK